MDNVDEIYAWIKDMMALELRSEPGDTGYPEEAPEMPEVSPEEYREGMQRYLEEAGLTDEQIEQVLDQLEAEGAYDADGYHQNIVFVIENNEETINNHVDNSIEIGEGAHVDDIYQENDTNQSTASGDGAVAGRDQDGQFQTGDGVQTGEGNSGVVNQGDNSGQQAGGSASGGDFTTGDGNFDNEGYLDNSAVAFGGGDATNETDQSENASVNDSYNQDNVGNTEWSGNTSDSYNYDSTTTHEESYNADLDVKVEDSFKVELEGEGYGQGHQGYDHEEVEPYRPEVDDYKPEEHHEPEGYGEEPEPYEVPQLPEPEGYAEEPEGYEEDPHCEPEEEPAEYLAES